MWKQRQLFLLTACVITVVIAPSAWAEVHPQGIGDTEQAIRETEGGKVQLITEIPYLNEVEHPITSVKEWEAQLAQTPDLAQVTAVQLKPTSRGLEVILETAAEFPEVLTSSIDNSLITDIPNAQLRLPKGGAFRQDNPTPDIALVEVTNLDAKTLRVTVTGKAGVPTAEVSQSPQALILSVAAPPAPAPQPTPAPVPPPVTPVPPAESQQPAAPAPEPQAEEAPVELTLTAEEEAGGYNVPDATTATKTDTPLRDIPQSIQVVPQQVIEDQQVTRIVDALRNVSGVTKEGSYGDSTDAYRIRGFVTFDSLRNGFRIQDPVINPTNIERIEVLKGPASVLYGQFEPGGIVNFVTKQPLGFPYYSSEFTVGSFDYYRPSIDLSGPLTTDEKLLYRLNAAYETTGDFVDFVDSNTLSIAPALTYKLSDNTTLTFEYEYNRLDRVFNDGLPPLPIIFELPISRFLGEPDINDSFIQESNNSYWTLDHRFSENLQLRTGFAAYFTNFAIGDQYIRPSDELDVDGRTLSHGLVTEGSGVYSSYNLQTDLIGKFNTGSIKHQVLLGFDWLYSDYSTTPYTSYVATPIDIFDPVYGAPQPNTELEFSQGYRTLINAFGIYLQDQITLLPNLRLLLGGRVEFNDQKILTQDFDGKGNPISDEKTDASYDTPFTPRIGIVYQPIEPISLYFSYSQSFKPNSSRTADDSALPPELGTQYEVGIKAELIQDRLSATFAAYDITKQNVATTDLDNPDFSIAAGEVKSRGLEFDLSGEILPGWNVIASYFVNDAFVSEDNSLPVGDKLANAPGAGGSLWTIYEFQTGGLKGLGSGAGVFYTGDREASLPNELEIPSYVRADAAIYYIAG